MINFSTAVDSTGAKPGVDRPSVSFLFSLADFSSSPRVRIASRKKRNYAIAFRVRFPFARSIFRSTRVTSLKRFEFCNLELLFENGSYTQNKPLGL
jgi:hypothetical protein